MHILHFLIILHFRYMVSTVEFGEGGITTNYGIPKMNKEEQRAFQKSVATLYERQKLVKEYVKNNLY